jgi:hypothetical protein
MARDCPDRYELHYLIDQWMLTSDRQRGADWRNGGPGAPAGPTAGHIGTGDAVDREYDVSCSTR